MTTVLRVNLPALAAAMVAVCLAGTDAGAEGVFEETTSSYGIEQIAFNSSNDYYWLAEKPDEAPAPFSAALEEAAQVELDGDGDKDEESLAERLSALEEKFGEMDEAQDDLKSSLKGYAKSGTGLSTMKVSGRVHYDMWGYPASSPGVNGFETGDNAISPAARQGFRRMRFGVGGDIWKNMVYRIEMEFAGGNKSEFRDAYLGFNELPYLQTVLLGNQKRPYGLDHLNSSRYNVFIERPFAIEAFNQDARRIGACAYGVSQDEAYNWRYGVYNQRLIQDEGNYISNHWQMQVAGRLANTIWYDECSDGRGYAHVAIAGTWADTDGTQNTENYADSGINEARFRTRPEARTVSRWLDTGVIANADDYSLIGFENVINVGAFQFCGEYQNVWLDRDIGSDLRFHGGYFYVSYFLTGEHIPWNRRTGTLGRVKPFENFFLVDTCCDGVRGGWGAWEVAVRFSRLDLSDNDIQGGIGESVTFGMNWYWNPNARMQFNYIYGNIWDNADNAVGGIDYGDYQILGARFMVDF
ncbi:OprO/OprP family phosphate-selective porin [Aeoliella sp.]|uniref:OprO/OprP family phosphate-selective porin n=1 Tax=Aeoliella sp. TaxID=2795800 RepID=UPI003CCBD322